MGDVRSSCCPIFDAVLRKETQQQLKQPDLQLAPGSRPMERGRDGRTIMAHTLLHLFINHSWNAEWLWWWWWGGGAMLRFHCHVSVYKQASYGVMDWTRGVNHLRRQAEPWQCGRGCRGHPPLSFPPTFSLHSPPSLCPPSFIARRDRWENAVCGGSGGCDSSPPLVSSCLQGQK